MTGGEKAQEDARVTERDRAAGPPLDAPLGAPVARFPNPE
jgi:hypothetical protein